jgi:nucleoside-diphosphate-sugar epimerase
MARVLVTGADGFIGRQTLPPLAGSGHEVHATFHPDVRPPLEEQGCTWHACDLLDREEQRRLLYEVKPTHLLHLAWYTKPGTYWNSPKNLRWVEASLALVLNFKEAGGERLVVAGSCAEYDWSFGRCSETTTPTRPATLYGACKHSLHQIIESYSAIAGLSYAWGRMFFVYGPYEHAARFLPSLIRSLLQQKTFLCRYGEHVRDFLFVRDAGAAFARLLESKVQGPVNIASGRPIALRDLATMAAEALGRPDLVGFDEAKALSSEPLLLLADVGRLTREVGWTEACGFDAGLRETIDWWKKTMEGAG